MLLIHCNGMTAEQQKISELITITLSTHKINNILSVIESYSYDCISVRVYNMITSDLLIFDFQVLVSIVCENVECMFTSVLSIYDLHHSVSKMI